MRNAVLVAVKRQLNVQNLQRDRTSAFQVVGGVDGLPALSQQMTGRPARTGVFEVGFRQTAHLFPSPAALKASENVNSSMKLVTIRSIVLGSKSAPS